MINIIFFNLRSKMTIYHYLLNYHVSLQVAMDSKSLFGEERKREKGNWVEKKLEKCILFLILLWRVNINDQKNWETYICQGFILFKWRNYFYFFIYCVFSYLLWSLFNLSHFIKGKNTLHQLKLKVVFDT